MNEYDEILVKNINNAIDHFKGSTVKVNKIKTAGVVEGLFSLLNDLNNNHATTISLVDDMWDNNINNEGYWEVVQYLGHVREVQTRADNRAWTKRYYAQLDKEVK